MESLKLHQTIAAVNNIRYAFIVLSVATLTLILPLISITPSATPKLIVFGQISTLERFQELSRNLFNSSLGTISSPTKQAQSSSKDDIIPVNIQLQPAHYLYGKNYLATGVNFTATAEITDEKFKNQLIIYQWVTKNTSITTGQDKQTITYKFDKADPDTYLKVNVMIREAHASPTGTSTKSIVVRDPVSIAEPVDKLFIEHGEMLDVSFKFLGTGPFLYCYELYHSSYKHDCFPLRQTEDDKIRIIRYLRWVGNYTLILNVNNIASEQKKAYSVRVIETPRESTVPYVPIVCSASAVLILLIGFALHLKFRSFPIFTETADFDFTRTSRDDSAEEEELWDEEQSFIQRVKLLFLRSMSDRRNSSMTSSNYADRSRLIN